MTLDDIEVITQNSIRIRSESDIIYIDPIGIVGEPHDADYILITHDHYDHFSPEDIEKLVKTGTILVVPSKMAGEVPDDTLSSVGSMIKVKPGECKKIKNLRFETVYAYNKLTPFHPKKSGWVGYILILDGKRIYIAGDTDITPDIESVECNIALLPIGGTYTMNALQAAQLANVLKPEIVIPTHYGSIIGKPEDAEIFKSHVDGGIKVEIKLHA